ncbi:hypothetical protein FSW04_24595 [Baekduia soli]|uniref:Uncharacterized protein n=1 Tax=Baekduia soli TaxID=496014 RepID=A0A5B8UB58_9ACTN|nr:hypothetical protein [Baekduia soli]QEC50449.1 hypothetical protein FSW04_24595 [Baekduia soli]
MFLTLPAGFVFDLAMTCEENCPRRTSPRGWIDISGSWQWYAILWSALIAFVAAIIAPLLNAAGWRRSAIAAFGVSVAAAGGWAALIASGYQQL